MGTMLDRILPLLPRLTNDELDELSRRINVLRPKSRELRDEIYNILLDLTGNRLPPLVVVLRSKQGMRIDSGLTALENYCMGIFSGVPQVERRRGLLIILQIILDDINQNGRTVSPVTVADTMKNVAPLVERAFPGYQDSQLGLLTSALTGRM